MTIDFNKIKEIYGEDCLYLIKENIDDVEKNIKYLNKLGFEDTIDIFERCTYLFIEDNETFKDKINELI